MGDSLSCAFLGAALQSPMAKGVAQNWDIFAISLMQNPPISSVILEIKEETRRDAWKATASFLLFETQAAS